MKAIPVVIVFAVLTLAARAEPGADREKLVAANTGFAFDLMNRVTQARLADGGEWRGRRHQYGNAAGAQNLRHGRRGLECRL
jgi:hypothetical protein